MRTPQLLVKDPELIGECGVTMTITANGRPRLLVLPVFFKCSTLAVGSVSLLLVFIESVLSV
jgi:hypothetical protein